MNCENFVLNSIANDGFILTNKKLCFAFNINTSVLLGELASKYRYFKQRKMLTEDGWFFCTVEDLYKSTSITRMTQFRIIKELEKLGILFTQQRGIPQKRYFKINFENSYLMRILNDECIENGLESNMHKMGALESTKWDDSASQNGTTVQHKKCELYNKKKNKKKNNIYMSEKNFLKNDDTNAPTDTKLTTEKSRTNFVSNEERKQPPTLSEVEDYICFKNYQLDAKEFYDHYYNNDWCDSKGNLVTKENYRLKVSMWKKNNFKSGTPKPSEKVPPKFSKEEQLKKQQIEDQKEQERQERLSTLDIENMKKQLEETLSKAGMASSFPRETLLAEILGRSKNQK